jgi:hypothetical protein
MGGKTHLDHDFHEVFLGNNILALDDLLENGGEDGISVELQIDAVELREANEICANQNTKVFPFRLTLLAVARVTLVLKAHPELIHFDEVGELESDGIFQISRWPAIQSGATSRSNRSDTHPVSKPIGKWSRVWPLR